MSTTPLSRRLGFALLVLHGATSGAPAQCANPWLAGPGIPGVDETAYATTIWDPDGPGPATPRLAIGGRFAVAGTKRVTGVVSWDPVSGEWDALGAAFTAFDSNGILALAAMPNGDLVAGGQFSFGSGISHSLARWNGTTWSPLGGGVSDSVLALLVLPNGDLIAGGLFQSAGGLTVNRIARWDGTTWSALGSGMDDWVRALAVLQNGDIVAGGLFTAAGGTNASRIARWDGTAWSPLGSGVNNNVNALLTLPNGDLVAGGPFTSAGGVSANRVARWDGSSWSPIGPGLLGSATSLGLLPNGDLVAGGFTGFGVARFNGSTWSSSFGPGSTVHALASWPNGDLVAVGTFIGGANGGETMRVATWNGTAWSAVGAGINKEIRALTVLSDGSHVIGGSFTRAGPGLAKHVARWNGTDWVPLGAGPPFAGPVGALATAAQGDLVAGTSFHNFVAPTVARWDGATWIPLGAGVNGIVEALLPLPNGDLVVSGRFNMAGGAPANFIARWDGTAWSSLGVGMNNGVGASIPALTRTPTGDIIAGGFFSTAGGVSASNIARWDGTAWSPLGSGTNGAVLALTALANGDVIAGGSFTSAGGVAADNIARWNGSSWSPLGSGITFASGVTPSVYAVGSLPNGDIVAAGRFAAAGGVAVSGLARWNGTSWSDLAGGVAGSLRAVRALAQAQNGDLLLGGDFLFAGAGVSAHFARLSTSCPATAVPYGNGCAGSSGPVALRADSLPWVGSDLVTTCTGMANGAFGLSVLGLNAVAVPLSSLHSAGGAGCELLASLEVALLLASSNGRLVTRLAIPLSPELIGASLRHQVLQIELDQQFHVVLITSSNGLTLTLGAF